MTFLTTWMCSSSKMWFVSSHNRSSGGSSGRGSLRSLRAPMWQMLSGKMSQLQSYSLKMYNGLYQIFRNRNQDFFPRPNFSETETDTFLPRPNFPKPKPRLFSETKFFRNRNRDFFSETKFFETETLKNLAKVSRPRPKPRLLNIFWNEIRKIWDLQAKLEFLGPKFGTLIVNWVKIISAR